MQASFYERELLGHSCEVIKASFETERFDRHFHDEFSIGLVTSGANVFSYRNKVVEAETGWLCVADPGDVHDGGLSGDPWSYTNLFVPAELLASVQNETEGFGSTVGTAKGKHQDPQLVAAFANLFRLLLCDDHIDCSERSMIDEAAVTSLSRLVEVNGTKTFKRRLTNDHAARLVVEAIRDVDGVGITLDTLAREAGVERYQLVRSVRRMIGVTPMAYALHLRVIEAKRLVLSGSSLAEAAAATGFSDQAHMTRRMKRLLGYTPGRLRSHSTLQ